MQAVFQRGDPARPRGHALLYFREPDDRDQLWATYIVVPPIALDLARYVPPMFAAQLASEAAAGPAAYPLPPFPEKVAGLAQLERLAGARDDDLLDGGTLDPSDLQRTLVRVTEIAQWYAGRVHDYLAQLPEPEPELAVEPEPAGAFDVDALLISLMTDAEKVSRLAKLTGTLRYAVEGGDEPLIRDTVAEMERVAQHLPERYRAGELIAAARRRDSLGGRLAELYIERCYKLANEDYAALPALEEQIRALQAC